MAARMVARQKKPKLKVPPVLEVIPLGNRLLLERIDPSERQGILYVPVPINKRVEARVLAVGQGTPRPDGTFTPIPVKPGDLVAVSVSTGQELTIRGKQYWFVRGEDIVAVLREWPAGALVEESR